MVPRSVWALLLTFVVAASTSAQSATFSVVTLSTADKERGQIRFRQVVPVSRPERREITELVDGKPVTRTVTVNVTASEQREVEMNVKDLEAYSGDGKPLDSEQLWKRLAPQLAVVVCNMGVPPKELCKVFQPDAVLFLVKPRPAPAPKPQ